MDKRARVRWSVLLSALAATVAAVVYPAADNSVVDVSGVAVPHAAKQTATLTASVDSTSAVDVTDSTGGDADPFAPRGWQAPAPVAPPTTVVQQPVMAPVVLAPAGPPSLPFRFVGNFSDGADQAVYLAHGDLAVVARLGDVIETNYKVIGVTPTQIEFEYLPTGDKQSLVFPARDN